MDNEMKARHAGFVNKRTWHKVKWTKGSHAGKFELFTDEDLEKNKESVEVVETLRTDMCTCGISYGYGLTKEEDIDKWIRENKR